MLERLCSEMVTDLDAAKGSVQRRRFGVIEVADGRFRRLRLRPLPKLISVPEIRLVGRWYHRLAAGDRCWLYYAQPFRYPNYLTIQYMVTSREAGYRTFLESLKILDQVAAIKKSDALLCELIGPRITREMMARWGWEPHCLKSYRRHYIKRL